jgi:hypothetical protein
MGMGMADPMHGDKAGYARVALKLNEVLDKTTPIDGNRQQEQADQRRHNSLID